MVARDELVHVASRGAEVEGLLVIRDREVFQLKNEAANFRPMLDKQMVENQALKEREAGLLRQLAESEYKFQNMLRDFDSLRGELAGKNEELRKMSGIIDPLRRDLDMKSQSEGRLLLEVSDLRNQLSGASGLQLRVRDLEGQLKDKEGFILSLNQSKRDLEERLRGVQDQNSSLEYQLRDMKAKLGDADKEAARLEGQLAVEGTTTPDGGGRGDADRMAVGRLAGERAQRDRAVGARPVFDDHGNAELRAEELAIHPRIGVGRAAGIEAYEDADGFGWPRLRARGRQAGCGQAGGGE